MIAFGLKVETLSEVFVFLCLLDIYFIEIDICPMVKYHASAPPFFLHIITKSSTVSSIDWR